ncbi:TSUP family transporter [Saccharopolyspora sp. NPDC000995]
MLDALNWPAFADLSLVGLAFLSGAAFLAWTVDAIVGGGGLIQLPAMLRLLPGGEVIYSLATNKVAAIAGTAAAARALTRSEPRSIGRPRCRWRSSPCSDRWAARYWPVLFALQVLNVVVLVALGLVGVHTWRKPELGPADVPGFQRRTQLLVMLAGGAVIGFYDGITGHGTGSFLVFLLVGLVGFAFVTATATAKVVNVATNIGALVFFIPAGKVLWGLA